MCTEARNFRDWMKQNFEQHELADMCTNGVINGFTGLCYYHETHALYEKYEKNIWELLWDDTESCGYKNPFELIANFKGADGIESSGHFENLLVWYAAEKIAYELTEGESESDDEDQDQ